MLTMTSMEASPTDAAVTDAASTNEVDSLAVPLLAKETALNFGREEEMELRRRNWWIIDGTAYDFANFIKRHPGGSAAISLGKGLDCTELFKTYHVMRNPPESLLQKFVVPLEEPYQFAPSRYTFEEDGFLLTVRRRAREYFVQNKLSCKGPMSHQIVAVIGVVFLIALLYPAFVMGSIAAALLHGVLKGLLAVTAGHGMSHFSLFTKSYLNTLIFRLFAPFVLSSHEIWSTSHIISHHIHTLTHDDLQDNYPVKRVQPSHKFLWFHRFQCFYIIVIYLFGLPLWTFSDWVGSVPSLFTGKHKMRYLPLLQRLENFFAITTNILLTLLLPFFVLPLPHAFLVMCCSNIPASLITVIQIAVNHEVPETMNKVSNDVKIDWGTHQVITSHNFGVNSKIALHCSGGLNMQVEHHIFPSVHYTHYTALAVIVQQACKEFNLPYNQSPNIFVAVGKHFHLLWMNSKP